MHKKLIQIFFLILLISVVFAQETREEKINIYVFWSEGCPHCEKEIEYLKIFEENNSDLNLVLLEVTKNSDNADLLINVGKKLGISIEGVPFTLIGENYFKGWLNESTTGKQIGEAIKFYREKGVIDLVNETNEPKKLVENNLEKITLPFFGETELKNVSLPVLTIIIAFFDGFNPCAMWVLLFLISLLLGIKDKKKMWLFGVTFLFASSLVYFLFMAAWLNLFLFLGFIAFVRMGIGLIAILAGAYNLNDFLKNNNGGCKVTGSKKRKKVFEKLRKIIQEKSFFIALIGLIILAFAVNLVELICSAGLPAIYTQVLALTKLTTIEYYSYLLLYVFVFMLDDLIVFFLAMKTLQLTGFSTKYSKYSKLIGGALMLLIGIIMIVKPELLMFG